MCVCAMEENLLCGGLDNSGRREYWYNWQTFRNFGVSAILMVCDLANQPSVPIGELQEGASVAVVVASSGMW